LIKLKQGDTFIKKRSAEQTEKFRGRYRIESTRLKNWDYSSAGAYFVTICTKSREHFFGEIVDRKMCYSRMGEMAAKEWENTKNIRLNAALDEWVVMPNYIHGIIVIKNLPVETHCNASLRGNVQQSQTNRFGPQCHNLASVIRGFKGATAKNIHIAGFAKFAWQPGFYDRIIRNEQELTRIREYIVNNPMRWDSDRNNPENLYM